MNVEVAKTVGGASAPTAPVQSGLKPLLQKPTCRSP